MARLLLWVTVATPVTWGALWALERLMIGGVLGPDVMSVWFSVAGVGLALMAGVVVAYGFDRALMRRSERPAGSKQVASPRPARVTASRRAR